MSMTIDFGRKTRILKEPVGERVSPIALFSKPILISTEPVRMSESVRGKCAWVGCAEPSEAEIVGRPLCSHHFYLVAQRRLSALLGLLTDDEADRTLPPDVQRFLSEIVSETETLTSQSQQLTPERLEELLQLSVKAAELHKMLKKPI
jgi:hypothetical protein